jgi:nitrogen fixation-related uncharacterized protein|tara:strand:- start:31477 stop:31932 length:456 start_codon:yes stop_codon:yes gene_type:complete
MKDFLETTVGRILLIGIVVVIWGVNVVQFSDVLGNKEEVALQQQDDIDLSNLSLVNREQFVYKQANRDPFEFYPQPVRRQNPETNPVESYIRPRIAVLGVMDETIMVLDATRSIIVVKETDVFNGITVKSITQDSVIFEHENKPFVIKVRS